MRLTGFLRDLLACRGHAGHGGGVCIIRPDGIGDYILFRPFLPLIRVMFPRLRLTLCANAAWAALSMRYDAGLVDKWVVVERGRLKADSTYAADIFGTLRAEGFDVALNPLYSRDYLSDILTFATRAARRETPQGDLTNQPRLQWTVTGMLYTARHTLPSSGHFEISRTHAFLERVAGRPLAFPPMAWPAEDVPPPSSGRPFVVFSLGASVPEKRWSARHHAEVAAWVTEHARLDVVLCGGDDVRDLADAIMARLTVRLPRQDAPAPSENGIAGYGEDDMGSDDNRPRVVDAVGTMPLTDLPALLRRATAVVTHDSAVYHLALACGRPTVCIADGRGWRRFTPWPADLPRLQGHAIGNEEGEEGSRPDGVCRHSSGPIVPASAERSVCLNADGALGPIDNVAPTLVIEALDGMLRP